MYNYELLLIKNAWKIHLWLVWGKMLLPVCLCTRKFLAVIIIFVQYFMLL